MQDTDDPEVFLGPRRRIAAPDHVPRFGLFMSAYITEVKGSYRSSMTRWNLVFTRATLLELNNGNALDYTQTCLLK